MKKTGKRLLALLLVVMMVLSSATAVFADEPAVNADGAAVESVVDEAEPAEAAEAEPAEDPAQAEPAAEAEGGAADEATVADSEAADEAGEAAEDPAAGLNEAGDIETPEVPADQDSAIPLEITNNTGMFKAVTASVTEEGGKNCLVVALSSTGYRELFIGTYEEAVANGDNRDNWIHGYQNTDSKWEFKIPLTEGQTYYPVVAISQSYLTKYENGQNPLARAFYPRQMDVDLTARTLVTGDYDKTDDLAVTNNVKMFKVSKGALQTIGGPNSNGYKSILHLTMGSDSFDKAFIGRADDAAKAAEADIAVIDENKIFDITVRTMKTAGQPDTIETCIGTPTVMSFHSVSKDAWYERQLTIDESAKTLLIENVPEDNSWKAADFTYDGTTVTGLSDSGKAKIKVNPALVIPDQNPDGKDVVAIGDGTSGMNATGNVGTFGYVEGENIYVPTSVKLPAKLETIGKLAFAAYYETATEKVAGLTKIEFPSTLTTIGMQAFWYAPITEIVLPDSVTSLGNAAFMGTNQASKIVISKSLKEIPASAFMKNPKDITTGAVVDEIIIPDGVTSIGANAFAGNRVKKVVLPEGLTAIKGSAFLNNQLEELTIPASVTEIGSSAFSAVNPAIEGKLSGLVLSEGFNGTIGNKAFDSQALTTVELPESFAVTASNPNKGAFANNPVEQVILKGNAAQAAAYEEIANKTGYTFTIEADKDVINLSIFDEELMFKAVNAYIEKDGSDTFLVFALSAKGYEDIFAGTFDEAIANGKNKENWIHYEPATVECIYTTKSGEQNDGTAEKYQFRMPVTLNESGETRVPIVAISKSRVGKAEEADAENPDYSAAFTARQALINLDDNSVIFGNYKDTVEVDFTVTVDGKEITDIEMIEDGYDASYEDWTTHEKVESKIPLYVVKVPAGTTEAQITLNNFCDKYSVYYYTKEPDDTGYTQYVDRFIGEPIDEATQLSYTLADKAYPAKVDGENVIRVQSGYDENWYSENLYAIAFEEAGAIRLFGDTRYNTSLSVAEELKAALGVEKFENIVLATGKKFPDALAGGYLANHKAAPIILINDGNQAVIDYIKANLSDKGTIYILGSEGAIPASWISGLKGLTIKRLGGSDRYATNIEILKEAGVKAGSEILVATGKKFADALSASAVDLPILLVNGLNNSLDKTQIDYLKGLGKCTFHILGGEPAVSKGIENALKTYGSVDRISGPDRYATSVEIARKFYGDAKSVTLAVGTNFPDGLCGGVLACKKGAPLLLTADKKEADAAIPAFTSERGITSGYIYGGDNVLSAAVVQKALGGKAEITEKPYPAAETK